MVIEIEGWVFLKGEVCISGVKNFVLVIMVGIIFCFDDCCFSNLFVLVDIDKMC